jgi:predicted ATP-grasp superfamily ATP-dependent carboligase
VKVIIPVGYASSFFLSMKKSDLSEGLTVPLADFSTLKIASNKADSIRLADKIGVPVPKTYLLRDISDLEGLGYCRFPMVVKGSIEGGCVRYVNNFQDLKAKFQEILELQGVPPLVQEFIHGDGYGFFALYNHGNPRAVFMHRRIRELYPLGGPSTCAESVYDPVLMEYGLRILKALNWHGIAMVEFKKDSRDGTYRLMEINPKFWGSLDLAITSGVDFPFLLYKMAVDGDVRPVFSYKVGVKFMWPFPDDFQHVLNAKQDVKCFLRDFLDLRVNKNLDIRDLNPSLYTIMNGLSFLGSKLTGR